jgi:hypothetical protein
MPPSLVVNEKSAITGAMPEAHLPDHVLLAIVE